MGAKPLSKPMLGYLPIGPLGTNFSELLVKIQKFSFAKMHLKIWIVKWCPFCPGGDELKLTINVSKVHLADIRGRI